MKVKIPLLTSISLILILILILSRYNNENFITIGFIADFSSADNQLGIQSRNSIQIAIDEINDQNGIFGHHLLLETKDNKGKSELNRELIEYFENKGISIIIGPHRSEMAESVLNAIKGKDLIVISPVVGSDDTAGIKDNFFRLNSLASSEGRLLGEAIVARKEKSLALVWNNQNKAYTSYVISGLKEVLNHNSIPIVYEYSYNSTNEFNKIVESLKDLSPEGIVFSTNATDSAMIIQQLAKNSVFSHFYGCEWTNSTDISTFGGKTVEGMILVGTVNNNPDKQQKEDFRSAYISRYSTEPSIFAYFAYESIMLLREAMLRSGKNITLEDIRKELVEIKDFSSILGPIGLDSYGDSIRQKQLYIIENNQYVKY